MRRNAPVVIVAVGLLTLLVAFVWYSQSVLTNLRSEAKQTAAMYAKVYGAISDTASDASAQTRDARRTSSSRSRSCGSR